MNINEKTPFFPKKKQKTNENNSPNINLSNKTSNDLNSTFEITNNKKNSTKENFNFFKISEDERFSLLKINKIKNKKFSPYKTTSRLIKNYKNCDNSNNSTTKKYYNLLKKKKINSLQKKFVSEVEFFDEITKTKKIFKIFRDCEIGINENWQDYQQIVFNDDDINSDNEEIQNGTNVCLNYIKNTIDFMKKNKKYKNISFFE